MDAYPDYGIAWSSPAPVADHGQSTAITAAGTIRERLLYAVPVWVVEVEHPVLTLAETDVLMDFYLAHKTSPFVMTHPLDHSGTPHDYEIHSIDPPQISTVADSPEYRSARVRMIGYRL